MRRMRFAILLCLILLLVPIYLWKVQGWWTVVGNTGQKLDPTRDQAAFNALDVGNFERGIIAGAAVCQTSRPDDIELLARTDGVELLRQSLLKYQQSVKSYTCTLCKQERVKGKLNPPEVIEAWFKEEPYSVLMHWKEGAGLASASLYVTGENDGMMCVRLAARAGKFLGIIKNAPDSNEAKDNTRYLITEFGLRCGTERTYKAWKNLRDRGTSLQVEYLGLRKNVEEAGGRDCHVVRRICNPPEEEGLTNVTIYIDAETWFQVGSVLMAGDSLIGSYWFKDINLNAVFDDKLFKPETLKKY